MNSLLDPQALVDFVLDGPVVVTSGGEALLAVLTVAPLTLDDLLGDDASGLRLRLGWSRNLGLLVDPDTVDILSPAEERCTPGLGERVDADDVGLATTEDVRADALAVADADRDVPVDRSGLPEDRYAGRNCLGVGGGVLEPRVLPSLLGVGLLGLDAVARTNEFQTQVVPVLIRGLHDLLGSLHGMSRTERSRNCCHFDSPLHFCGRVVLVDLGVVVRTLERFLVGHDVPFPNQTNLCSA